LCFASQVGGSIKSEHQESGKSKQRVKRTNHQSTSTLLDLLTHSDLLDDQDNEDEAEHGRLLVRSAKGWWTEMAKWIGDAQWAADDEDLDLEDRLPQACMSKWKPVTLAVLFAGQKEKFVCRSTQSLDQREANLMKGIAEMDEDERLDDGTIEIPSDNEQWVYNTLWQVVRAPRMCHKYKKWFLGWLRASFQLATIKLLEIQIYFF
jgi:hypothetical protein